MKKQDFWDEWFFFSFKEKSSCFAVKLYLTINYLTKEICACLPLALQNGKEGRAEAEVYPACRNSVTFFKHTFSSKWSVVLARRHLALGRQKCHSRWTDQLLPAMGKSERTHAQLLPWETVSQGPSPGRQGGWSLCTLPSRILSFPLPRSWPWAARFALQAAFPSWATREDSFTLWRLQYKQTPRATACWRAGFFQGKVSSIPTNSCGLIQAYPLIQVFVFYVLSVYQDHWEKFLFDYRLWTNGMAGLRKCIKVTEKVTRRENFILQLHFPSICSSCICFVRP